MQEEDLEGGARGLDAAFATADSTTLGGVESLASARNSQTVLYIVTLHSKCTRALAFEDF